MRSAVPSFSFIQLATLIWICSGSLQAQTRAACGCAFVRNQQPQNVSVLFAGETQATAAKADMVVHIGDIIKIRRPVNATLICDNVTRPIPLQSAPRNQPVPCRPMPEDGILIGRNGRSIEGTTMGDISDVGFPVVLSPRSTKILSSRPVLMWTSIPKANTYRVTVRGDQESWSTTVAPRPGLQINEILYPPRCGSPRNDECAPTLTFGQSYKLIVEANNRSSEEEDLPNLGFSLLTPAEAQQLKTVANGLTGLAIGTPLKTKMLASLYANRGLNADAIKVLEDDSMSPQNPEAVRLLGNLYLRIGLPRKAEAGYLKLLEPTFVARDTPIGRAITNQTLAELYEGLGNRQEAIRYYLAAKNIYRAMNDREATNRIDSRLADLR